LRSAAVDDGGRFADDWLFRLGLSSGCLLSWLLSRLLGGLFSLGRRLSLDGGTELGERRLWLFGLVLACWLVLLRQPRKRRLALITLDGGSLGLGLAVGDRGSCSGGFHWGSGWGHNTSC
jgi:hypothetical protein